MYCVPIKIKYILYHVLWKKTIFTCISIDRLLLHYYILELLVGEKTHKLQSLHYGNSGNRGDIVCLHSEAAVQNMQPWGAGCALI